MSALARAAARLGFRARLPHCVTWLSRGDARDMLNDMLSPSTWLALTAGSLKLGGSQDGEESGHCGIAREGENDRKIPGERLRSARLDGSHHGPAAQRSRCGHAQGLRPQIRRDREEGCAPQGAQGRE